jgi:hypothetical protein
VTVLPAELELDASAALAQADALRDAIEQGLSEGGEAGAESIGAAISGADFTVPLEVDSEAAIAGVEDFQAFAESAAPEIPIDADASAAEARLDELEGLFASAEATIPVDADTSGAEASVDELSGSIEDAGGAAGHAESNVRGLGTASSFLGASVGAAKGEVGGLAAASEKLGGGIGAATKAIGAGAAAFTALFVAGEKSIAADERLEVVFGGLAERVKSIDVGGLNGELRELAIQSGSSGAQIKFAIANLGQLALSAGQSKSAAADFSSTVAALSLRAAALNPNLGEAGDLADKMGLALARGGRFAAKFGLDLNMAEITARALANTGKSTAAELSIVEKAMAGAQIATEKLGDSIGTDFQKGIGQSAVQLKALEKALVAAFAQAGRPLVEPTIEALESLAPIAENLSTILGTLASAVLPVVGTAFAAIGAVLGPVAEGLAAIPAPILAIATAFLVLRSAAAANVFASIVGNVEGAASSLIAFGATPVGAVVLATAAIAALGLGAAKLFGAFDDGPSHADRFKASLEGIQKTVLANSSSLEGAATDLASFGTNFDKFVRSSSAFKLSNQIDDLHDMGESTTQLSEHLERGRKGLVEFIQKGIDTDQISASFSGVELTAQQLADAIEHPNHNIRGLGISFREAAESGAGLESHNLALADSFVATQEAIQKANRETVNHLVETGQLPPQYAAIAEAQSRSTDGTINWANALELAVNATTRILPNMTAMQAELLRGANQFSAFSDAATKAAANLPTVGSLLSTAADDIQKFTGTLDPALVTQHLGEMFTPIQNFFNNVATLAQTGSTSLATALLQIGPQAGAGLAQSLIDAGPQVQAGAEQMVSGITDAMFAVQVQLQVEAEKAKVIAGSIGSGTGQALLTAFGATNFGELQSIPLSALQTAAEALANDGTLPGGMARLVKNTVDTMHSGFGAVPKEATDATGAATTAVAASEPEHQAAWTAWGLAGKTGRRIGQAGMKEEADADAAAVAKVPVDHEGEAREGGRRQGAAQKEGAKEGRQGMDTEAASDTGEAIARAIAEGTRHTGEFAEAGRALMHGFNNGLEEGGRAATFTARDIATSAAAAMRGTGDFAAAGHAAGRAFGDALGAEAGYAAGQARILARAAADAADNAGKKSPLWHDFQLLGETSGSALAAGLASQTSAVTTASHDLARAAANAVVLPVGTPGVNLGAVRGGTGVVGKAAVVQTNVQVRDGAVRLTLNPPAGATPAQVADMARVATTASMAELRSELAALGS